jgi:hypothetical protein
VEPVTALEQSFPGTEKTLSSKQFSWLLLSRMMLSSVINGTLMIWLFKGGVALAAQHCLNVTL